MEQIIVRTKTIANLKSKLILEYDNNSLHNILKSKGINIVLQNIFEETENSYQQLTEDFDNFVNNKNSSLFEQIYLINTEFGISINQNIYLYYFNADSLRCQENILPWKYADGKKYIGDSWWFEDEEILSDVQKLSFLEFIKKYKGY